ncbi:MAG: hypothetical protein OYK82_01210 [Gammaproteobacteria bacterium]|nr:hypothetical protein [Gammaproteobacteria bacterium]
MGKDESMTVVEVAAAAVIPVVLTCQNTLPCDASNTIVFFEAATEADVSACLRSGAALESGDVLNWRPLHRCSVAADGYEGVW